MIPTSIIEGYGEAVAYYADGATVGIVEAYVGGKVVKAGKNKFNKWKSGDKSPGVPDKPISYCFVAGTPVAVDGGNKPIENVQVGDEVLAMDYQTGEVAVKEVTRTFVNETSELVHVKVNGETISATPNHPFYSAQFGRTLAANPHVLSLLKKFFLK